MASSMTRYRGRRIARPPLSARRTLFLLFLSAVALACALGHLHLRFVLSDLNQESVALQNRKMELRSEVNRLRGDVEARKQADHLLEFGERELGMIRYSPADLQYVSVERAVADRYANAELVLAGSAAAKPAASNPSWGKILAAGLGVEAPASATPNQD